MENAKGRNMEQIEIKTKEQLCSSVLLSFFPKKTFVFYRKNNGNAKMIWRADYGG